MKNLLTKKHLPVLWVIVVTSALLALGSCGPKPDTIESRLIDPQGTRKVLYDLQRALHGNDRKLMGELLGYPQVYSVGCEDLVIESEEDFLRHFDLIITSTVREAILSQRFEGLYANWQGVMLGKGEVWLTTSCDSVDEADKCIRWNTRAQIYSSLSEDPDCESQQIDLATSKWVESVSNDELRGESFYGSWEVVSRIEEGINCISNLVIEELKNSPLFLDSTKMILDGVHFEQPVTTLKATHYDSLVDLGAGSSFAWRRRAGLLADSVLVLNVTCNATLSITNPELERCYVRDSQAHNFWVVSIDKLIWPVGGALIVLERISSIN